MGDASYMQIFNHDATDGTMTATLPAIIGDVDVDSIPAVLRAAYLDTYYHFCFTWSPIISTDAGCDSNNSLMLRHGLALVGSCIRPPLTQHTSPSEHYERMKALFYGNHEMNPVQRLSALMLLHCWGSHPPDIVGVDTQWWWLGVTIRLAQELGVHRELRPDQHAQHGETPGLRRRVWWTLFARERLIAICQGRPCIIDLDYCDVQNPSLNDFPDPTDPRAQIFLEWVKLCGIIGRVGKCLLHRTEALPTLKCVDMAHDLIGWVKALQSNLLLSLESDENLGFNRDVHLLHLPYLNTITLLYLSKSTQHLPRASIAAIVSATCVARVFENFLARGSIRFVPGESPWYIAIAILALLHARRVHILRDAADAHIKTLRTALQHVALLWHSAKTFESGFERLLGPDFSIVNDGRNEVIAVDASQPDTATTFDELSANDGIDWQDYFPNVTTRTSPLIKILLDNSHAWPSIELDWPTYVTSQLQELNNLFDDNHYDPFNMSF